MLFNFSELEKKANDVTSLESELLSLKNRSEMLTSLNSNLINNISDCLTDIEYLESVVESDKSKIEDLNHEIHAIDIIMNKL